MLLGLAIRKIAAELLGPEEDIDDASLLSLAMHERHERPRVLSNDQPCLFFQFAARRGQKRFPLIDMPSGHGPEAACVFRTRPLEQQKFRPPENKTVNGEEWSLVFDGGSLGWSDPAPVIRLHKDLLFSMIPPQMGFAVPFMLQPHLRRSLRSSAARSSPCSVNAATLGALKIFGAGCYLIHSGLKPEANR